jgi:hypothetical protein
LRGGERCVLYAALAPCAAERSPESGDALGVAVEVDRQANHAAVYERLGQPEKRRETIQRHLEFMPQSILAREAL